MNRSSGQGGPPRDTQGSTIAVAYAQSPADGTLPKYRDLSPEINPDGARQDPWHDPSKVGGTSRESQMSSTGSGHGPDEGLHFSITP